MQLTSSASANLKTETHYSKTDPGDEKEQVNGSTVVMNCVSKTDENGAEKFVDSGRILSTTETSPSKLASSVRSDGSESAGSAVISPIQSGGSTTGTGAVCSTTQDNHLTKMDYEESNHIDNNSTCAETKVVLENLANSSEISKQTVEDMDTANESSDHPPHLGEDDGEKNLVNGGVCDVDNKSSVDNLCKSNAGAQSNIVKPEITDHTTTGDVIDNQDKLDGNHASSKDNLSNTGSATASDNTSAHDNCAAGDSTTTTTTNESTVPNKDQVSNNMAAGDSGTSTLGSVTEKHTDLLNGNTCNKSSSLKSKDADVKEVVTGGSEADESSQDSCTSGGSTSRSVSPGSSQLSKASDEGAVTTVTLQPKSMIKTSNPATISKSIVQGDTKCEIKIQPRSIVTASKTHEVITYTMDRKSNMVRKSAVAPGVKTAFNIQPPTSTSSSTSNAPSAQDIKDGHAYLRAMPKFLYQVGLSLLREFVYEGLSDHVGNLRKQGDNKYSEEQYQSLQKSLANLRKDNKDLHLKYDKVCPAVVDGKPCGFKAESSLALETHLSQSHVSQGHKLHCARCNSYTTALPTCFKNHMLDTHNVVATVVKPSAFYQCKMCHYESNTGSRVLSHMTACSKSFQLSKNLRPEGGCNTPLGESIFRTSKLFNSHPSPATQPTQLVQPSTASSIAPKLVINTLKSSTGTTTLTPTAHATNVAPITLRPSIPSQMSVVTQIGGRPTTAEVVSCEMCGGLIQGTQALRVHMQWCHNINITHLKNPAFHCPVGSCKKLFWTVQGLAKHTTTCKSVSEVTIPDLGNCCFLCRKPFQTTLVEHLLARHLSDLKKMVELKRCMSPNCSTKSFTSIDMLQSHLATEHRLKMTGLAGLATASVSNIKFQPFCSICKLKFLSSQDFAKHCAVTHVHKCDLCGAQCSTKQGLKEHENTVHPFRYCLVCNKQVKRAVFIQHVVHGHKATKCRAAVKRLSQSEYQMHIKKPKLEDWY